MNEFAVFQVPGSAGGFDISTKNGIQGAKKSGAVSMTSSLFGVELVAKVLFQRTTIIAWISGSCPLTWRLFSVCFFCPSIKSA